MPPARTIEELIRGMEFRSRARGRLIADKGIAEGKALGMLQAADEVEKLLKANGGDFSHFHDLHAWITATREAVAMSAAEQR